MSLHLENTPKYVYILEKPQLLIKEFLAQIKKINKTFNKIHPSLDKSEADQCTNFILGGMEHLSFELADKVAELIRDYKQLLKWYLNDNQASQLEDSLTNKISEMNNLKSRDDEEILVSDTGSSKYEVYSEPNENKEINENIKEDEEISVGRELRYQRTDDEDEESEVEFEEVRPKFEDENQLEELEKEDREEYEDQDDDLEEVENNDEQYDSEPKSRNLMESLDKISKQLKNYHERRDFENQREEEPEDEYLDSNF